MFGRSADSRPPKCSNCNSYNEPRQPLDAPINTGIADQNTTQSQGWQAKLELGFAYQHGKMVLMTISALMFFLAQVAVVADVANVLRLRKRIGTVKHTRTIGKKDLIHNYYQPPIEVDPQTYPVRADGLLLTCEPADVLPFAQRYFLF